MSSSCTKINYYYCWNWIRKVFASKQNGRQPQLVIEVCTCTHFNNCHFYLQTCICVCMWERAYTCVCVSAYDSCFSPTFNYNEKLLKKRVVKGRRSIKKRKYNIVKSVLSNPKGEFLNCHWKNTQSERASSPRSRIACVKVASKCNTLKFKEI